MAMKLVLCLNCIAVEFFVVVTIVASVPDLLFALLIVKVSVLVVVVLR